MSKNTNIQFKRTAYDINTLDTNGEKLQFAEPLVIDSSSNDKYLVLGPDNGDGTAVSGSIFFKGLSLTDAQKSVTYITDSNNKNILVATPSSTQQYLSVKNVTSTPINEISSTEKRYYIVCQDDDGNLYNFRFNDNIGVYIDNKGVMHGASWNDYAEGRHCEDCLSEHQLDGRVVCEDGKGNLKLSTERLQPCAYIVSDTFGTTIGGGNVNIALAGKALVYTDDEVEIGDCLAAGQDGKASKMSRQEIINYPDRIIGTVIEVPDYDTYNGISVDGRVWVNVK